MGKEHVVCNDTIEGIWEFTNGSVEMRKGESYICCNMAATFPVSSK